MKITKNKSQKQSSTTQSCMTYSLLAHIVFSLVRSFYISTCFYAMLVTENETWLSSYFFCTYVYWNEQGTCDGYTGSGLVPAVVPAKMSIIYDLPTWAIAF